MRVESVGWFGERDGIHRQCKQGSKEVNEVGGKEGEVEQVYKGEGELLCGGGRGGEGDRDRQKGGNGSPVFQLLSDL